MNRTSSGQKTEFCFFRNNQRNTHNDHFVTTEKLINSMKKGNKAQWQIVVDDMAILVASDFEVIILVHV